MKDLRSKAIMLTQQLEFIDDLTSLIDRVKSLSNLDRYALITHDKDKQANGNSVKPHIHLMMTFNVRTRINYLSKKLQQDDQYFEIMTKRGKSLEVSIHNGFAYLIHATNTARKTGKYQYSVNDVLANFDYPTLINNIRSQFFQSPKGIITDFTDGTIDKVEAIKRLKTCGGLILQRYLPVLDKINEANNIIKQTNWIKEKEKSHAPIKVVWVYGEAGTGKTSLAKKIAIATSTTGKFDFTGSSRDIFQSVGTEPSLIIDELRPNNIKYNDILKLLDNYNYRKNAPSRYYDKIIIADTIIITSPLSPIEFYEAYHLPHSDSFHQLNRRLSLVLKTTPNNIQEQTLTTSSPNNPKLNDNEQVIPITDNTIEYYHTTNTYPNKIQQQKQTKLKLTDIL